MAQPSTCTWPCIPTWPCLPGSVPSIAAWVYLDTPTYVTMLQPSICTYRLQSTWPCLPGCIHLAAYHLLSCVHDRVHVAVSTWPSSACILILPGCLRHHDVSASGAVHAGCGDAAKLAVRRGDVPPGPDDARRQCPRVDSDVDRHRRRPLLRHRPSLSTSHEDRRLSVRHRRRLAHFTVHIHAPCHLPEG